MTYGDDHHGGRDKSGTRHSGSRREASERVERRGKSTSRGRRDKAGLPLGASRNRSRARRGENEEYHHGSESRKAIYEEDSELRREEEFNRERADERAYYEVSQYTVDGAMKQRLMNRQNQRWPILGLGLGQLN